MRFVKFMQHLPGLAWIKDLEGRYVFANDAATRAFRRPRSDLYGKTDADLFPAETARAFRENDLAALASPSGLEAIETLVQEDGEHHSLVSKFAIPALDGTPSLIGGVAIDLTERLHIEVALRESEERFRSMADNAPVLIWMNGLEGCEFVNREYLRFVGRPFEDVTGMESRSFIHPDDAPEYVETYLRALGRQEAFEAQFRFRRADGEYRWMHSTGVPRLTSDGTMVGYVGCSVDITDIKRSEEALREADRRKDEFLATLAHELRNPLAPIRNSLHVLRVAPNAEGSERIHDILDRQVAQMVRLVDDLLEVSRITRGKIELRRERVSLGDALRSALETSRPLIEASHHDLTVSMPNEPLFVEADAVRLAQVFANLLNNAAKYTEEGGHIRVLVERVEGEVCVSVRDDGIGIPPDMLPKVFDLFTQIDRTLGRAQGGLGIGLALVKRLVEMHDGRVEARSTPGERGSEFIVVLPLAREQTRPDVRRRAPSAGSLPMMRVLVVDDNRDSADSLAIFLRHLGLEVSVAHDGFAALERAQEWLPSVVLLDLGMPRMDGYEVARRLRRDPAHASTLLIALTGWGQPEDRRRSAEAGFDHHLVKPVEFGVLRTLLGALPRRDAEA
jgi:PAS domain S-box-containing protein